jgi:subtilisin family serine protease
LARDKRCIFSFAGKILLVCLVLAPPAAVARSGSGTSQAIERYIVELKDPPLAMYDGRELSVENRDRRRRLPATAPHLTGHRRLLTKSQGSVTYLQFIAERQKEFLSEVSLLLGRPVPVVHRYSMATNGLAIDLSAGEAAIVAESPLVKSLAADERHTLNTYAGPPWVGAPDIWTGDAGFPEKRGEGIVIGVLDSGINWEHPSFDNPAIDGYVHANPLGVSKGLCQNPASGAQCNGKLIGVYDFVVDDPFTEDVVEENTNGRDNDGHGSHTASTAAGNPVNTFLTGGVPVDVSGGAPRANIISYRVCYIGEPAGPDTGGCTTSSILSAIEQAIVDGVDVINHSLGSKSGAGNPWRFDHVERAYLAAREAGIVVAASAGNDGPGEGTTGSPANSPWVMAVGNATHNAFLSNSLKNMVGGNTPAPGDMFGASQTGGTGQKVIVHARDYGNALCGAGPSEDVATCGELQGLSNPWEGDTPFNGEIVVCDRGTYGRVEKGFNVMLAGAGGYILANTDAQGESIVADDHCLPAIHVGDEDGDELRVWLAGGIGHGGAISGLTLVEDDDRADQVASSSARGPGVPPVEDVLKPNVVAPGVSILAASSVGQSFWLASGTSMSAPHVAGAAALLKSVHPDWSVNQIITAIETTATPELATDRGIAPATPHERGTGRPQLGEAVNAGLSLEVTASEFIAANPAIGGQPRDLNLPVLVNSSCQRYCTFPRRVTDQMGGGSWTASAVDFPENVEVTINPANFTLGNGQSRDLLIDIDLSGDAVIGEWVYGAIRLRAAGAPDQFLTVAVMMGGGDLPDQLFITDDRNGGWKAYGLEGLIEMPDATFASGALTRPGKANLVEDITPEDPYDGGAGVFTTWHSLPEGASWLYARTLVSTATDLDLYVGRDINGNGMADSFEEICFSVSEVDLEYCELFDLIPGDYWILVQNWDGGDPDGDMATLVHAVIAPTEENNFAVTGPGITDSVGTVPVRLSWNNLDALPGEQYFAAMSIGTHRETPSNIGFIPITFTRSAIADPETFPLMDGTSHHLALAANGTHDRLFIDIPPGANSLTVFANGADSEQSNGLTLELRRADFDDAFGVPPFAAPAGDAEFMVSADGVGGSGPSITVFGVEPGRWYAMLTNRNGSPSSVEIRASVEFQVDPIETQPGLWEPNSRPGLGQGYEDNRGGPSRALVWYTYDEAGQPAWYISGNPVTAGNIWTADLLRFTNDGVKQHSTPVGQVSLTSLGRKDAMFSYTLFGQSGTERMQPISAETCPQVNGSPMSYTGLWYRGSDGLGGASILANASTQSQIHYLFDDSGRPRWLVAQDLQNPEPTNPEMPMLQFSGYCAVCETGTVTFENAGVLQRSFASESTGSWTLDYLFNEPLSGSAERTDQIVKLTDELLCP